MQLRSVGGGCSWEEYFLRPGRPAPKAELLRVGARKMLALVRHLESEVPGPPQWVTMSHLIIMCMSDQPTRRRDAARVFVRETLDGFEIKYRSTREWLGVEESFTKLYARTVEETGQKVAEALRLAEPDPRGYRDG